jgi:putative transposase
MKQPKRGRLWLNDGSCMRLRPERPNHVWSYDFVQDRTEDCRAFRMLVVLDEFTRRCLASSLRDGSDPTTRPTAWLISS